MAKVMNLNQLFQSKARVWLSYLKRIEISFLIFSVPQTSCLKYKYYDTYICGYIKNGII